MIDTFDINLILQCTVSTHLENMTCSTRLTLPLLGPVIKEVSTMYLCTICLPFLGPLGASNVCGKFPLLTPILPWNTLIELKGVASPGHQIYAEFSVSSPFCTEPRSK